MAEQKSNYMCINKDLKLINRKENLFQYMNGKVLDIGCGPCELLIKATKLGYNITGLEVSPNNIKEARKLAEASSTIINLVEGSIENLPFKENSFDTIIMGDVIEHLFFPVESIQTVLKILKPEGKLIITTPVGFAHPDPDHKNFFFTKKELSLLNKMWMFDILSPMFTRIFKIIDIEYFFKNLIKQPVEIQEHEWTSSKHPSLDFVVIITKRDK